MADARLLGAFIGRSRSHVQPGADQRKASIADDIDRQPVLQAGQNFLAGGRDRSRGRHRRRTAGLRPGLCPGLRAGLRAGLSGQKGQAAQRQQRNGQPRQYQMFHAVSLGTNCPALEP